MTSNTKDPVLVVLQMSGAFDALNTVIPYNNPLYPDYRPVLKVDPEQVLDRVSRSNNNPPMTLPRPEQTGDWTPGIRRARKPEHHGTLKPENPTTTTPGFRTAGTDSNPDRRHPQHPGFTLPAHSKTGNVGICNIHSSHS